MKINIIIYDKHNSTVFQRVGNMFKTRYEDVSEPKEIDNFKYHELENPTDSISKVWIAKHDITHLKNEIIKDDKINEDFYNSLPEEIKDADKLIIAGHWGDHKLDEYKLIVKNINENQEKILPNEGQKYFVSYFGSELSKYNGNLLSDIVPEILELYNFTPSSFAKDIVYFYSTSQESLVEYQKSIKDQEDKKIVYGEIARFINQVKELESSYAKLVDLLKS